MTTGDDSFVHWLLGAMGSLIAAVGGWSWIDLNRKLNQKADESELQQLREDLRERWRHQDAMHAENRTRLDRIMEGITVIRNGR